MSILSLYAYVITLNVLSLFIILCITLLLTSFIYLCLRLEMVQTLNNNRVKSSGVLFSYFYYGDYDFYDYLTSFHAKYFFYVRIMYTHILIVTLGDLFYFIVHFWIWYFHGLFPK